MNWQLLFFMYSLYPSKRGEDMKLEAKKKLKSHGRFLFFLEDVEGACITVS